MHSVLPFASNKNPNTGAFINKSLINAFPYPGFLVSKQRDTYIERLYQSYLAVEEEDASLTRVRKSREQRIRGSKNSNKFIHSVYGTGRQGKGV